MIVFLLYSCLYIHVCVHTLNRRQFLCKLTCTLHKWFIPHAAEQAADGVYVLGMGTFLNETLLKVMSTLNTTLLQTPVWLGVDMNNYDPTSLAETG